MKQTGRGVGAERPASCYWDVASSSRLGFRSTTVVPLREAPPSAAGAQLLLAPGRHQNAVRTPSEPDRPLGGSVTCTPRGGRRQRQDTAGSAPSASVGLGADVGVTRRGFLLVVVAMQLVLHQQDEDEDEHRRHDDPADDDDHGAAQELEGQTGS